MYISDSEVPALKAYFSQGIYYTILVCFFLILQTKFIFSQNVINPINSFEKEKSNALKLYAIENNESDFELQMNSQVISQIKQTNFSSIQLSFPLSDQTNKNFTIQPIDFFESNFKIYSDDQGNLTLLNLDRGLHYQADIVNQPESSLCLNSFNDEWNGLMQFTANEQFQIKSENKIGSRSKILFTKMKKNINHNFECGSDDQLHYIQNEFDLLSRTKQSCKRTQISVRADYQLYLKFNKNAQQLTNYITSLFNQINSIYRKEEIQISLSEIIINTTPDLFQHTSANIDLNYLKSNYKSYNGNIHICLSGFSNKSVASLGGVAYINALCQKTYAYAFANVEGKLNDLPNFCYDVFLAAHELGHVFGSRHTHACVWGPNKNQAIDNCAKVEGNCPAGPKPIKGSLMSYCHLSGNPGIDLNIGFGQEPGDLIRESVNKSSCLNQYSPSPNNLMSTNQHISANVECFDGTYTNYYFDNNTIDDKDDILIASIKKNNQNIGKLSDQSLIINAHTTNNYGKGTAQELTVKYSNKKVIVANRYWEIISQNKLDEAINIKFYFTSNDVKEMQAKIPIISTENLAFFNTPTGDANPDNQLTNIDLTNYNEFKNDLLPDLNKWQLSRLSYGNYSAEFQSKSLNDFGLTYNPASKLSDEITSRSSSNPILNFQIYPQPIENEELNISLENIQKSNSKLKLIILTLDGQEVLKNEIELIQGVNKIKQSTQLLKPGIYILKWQCENISASSRLVVTK